MFVNSQVRIAVVAVAAVAAVACLGCAQASTMTSGGDAVVDSAVDGDASDSSDASALGDVATVGDVANDLWSPDAAPDAPAVDAVLADSVDAAPADAGSGADVGAGCGAILAKIDALKPALGQCNAQTGCQNFEYPICGSFGCFQLPLAANADTTELQSLSAQAAALSCEPFHCGCGEMLSPSYCLKGQCRSCPPDCDGSCQDLTLALVSAAHSANACGSDKDCTVLSTGLCPVGDLPCGGLYVNTYAKQADLQALITAYSQACGASTCKCAISNAVSCVGGKCVAK